ncbi:hypothetical protein [Sphingomonas sp.]|jgi:hypothetical protein|uniref:hypothetical protein n=1 Tax=Sphingomonas sp. TaxID=28214 RepID=UPI003BAC3234
MMMTLQRLDALKKRADNAPASMQPALMVEFGVAVARRKRERGPNKLARRLRRGFSLGRGTY